MFLPAFRWAFNVRDWRPSKEQFLFCLRCIQPQERERVMGFVYKKDAKPALIGRLMLRKCVAETLRVPYDSVLFNRSEKGKPQVNAGDGNGNYTGKFDLNVSHQGDYCVLASDAYEKVGVDTMKVEFPQRRTLKMFFSNMTKVFTSSEWDYIKEPGINESTQLLRFMRLWTLKESYVKAEGFGITVDLQSIAFECPDKSLSTDEVYTSTRLLLNGKHSPDWTFEESLLDSEHTVAVAFNETTAQRSNIFKHLNYNELIEGARPLDEELNLELWDQYNQKEERPGQR